MTNSLAFPDFRLATVKLKSTLHLSVSHQIPNIPHNNIVKDKRRTSKIFFFQIRVEEPSKINRVYFVSFKKLFFWSRNRPFNAHTVAAIAHFFLSFAVQISLSCDVSDAKLKVSNGDDRMCIKKIV